MQYIVFDASGEIVRTGHCEDDEAALMQAEEGQFAIKGVADDTIHYIDVETRERRDKLQITAVLTGRTLSGLPIPATVTIERVRYDVQDGEVELSFTLPGTYQVRVEARHFLPKTFEVEG